MEPGILASSQGCNGASRMPADVLPLSLCPGSRNVVSELAEKPAKLASRSVGECCPAHDPGKSGQDLVSRCDERVPSIRALIELHEVEGEPVPEAGESELHTGLTNALLDRLRSERLALQDYSDTELSRMIGALVEHEGRDLLTLGGLLALGTAPQRFFPELSLTFVA